MSKILTREEVLAQLEVVADVGGEFKASESRAAMGLVAATDAALRACIAAILAAPAKGGHATTCSLRDAYSAGEVCNICGVDRDHHLGWLCKPRYQYIPKSELRCNCHLSTLSDDIERGKELLDAVKGKERLSN